MFRTSYYVTSSNNNENKIQIMRNINVQNNNEFKTFSID